MDLGITNRFIFYVRSWLILSIVISQPSFDHRLTLAIYLTASVWANQYKRNREFGLIHSPKFHDTFHVSKNLIKTSYYYIRSKSLITPYSTQRTRPQCSPQYFYVWDTHKHTQKHTHAHVPRFTLERRYQVRHTHAHIEIHVPWESNLCWAERVTDTCIFICT